MDRENDVRPCNFDISVISGKIYRHLNIRSNFINNWYINIVKNMR
jgi:hypothetical protein